jgi:acyl carrier protein
MNDIHPRLVRCFETVFPQLSQEQIETASQATVAKWDSVAAITLVNVVEEEFQTVIDLEMLPELDSFQAISAHLQASKSRT